jgi:hypothetical protein
MEKITQITTTPETWSATTAGPRKKSNRVREMQRQFLEKDRKAYLTQLRGWLERGCESLN